MNRSGLIPVVLESGDGVAGFGMFLHILVQKSRNLRMQINGLLDRLLQEGSLTLMGGSRKPRPPFDLAADGDDLGVLHRCASIGDAFAQLQNTFARVLQVGQCFLAGNVAPRHLPVSFPIEPRMKSKSRTALCSA